MVRAVNPNRIHFYGHNSGIYPRTGARRVSNTLSRRYVRLSSLFCTVKTLCAPKEAILHAISRQTSEIVVGATMSKFNADRAQNGSFRVYRLRLNARTDKKEN